MKMYRYTPNGAEYSWLRSGLGAGVVLLSVLALTGCGRRKFGRGPTFAGASANGAWIPTTSDGGVSFETPLRPQRTQEVRLDDDGAQTQITTFRASIATGIFAVMVLDYEGGAVGNPLTIAAAVSEGITNEVDVESTDFRRINVPGYFAFDSVSRIRGGGGMIVRQILGRRRSYIAICGTLADQTGSQMAERFLNSLRPDPSDALYQTAGLGSSEWTTLYLPPEAFSVSLPPVAGTSIANISISNVEIPMHIYESADEQGRQYRMRVLVFGERTPLNTDAEAEVAERLGLGERTDYAQVNGFPMRHAESVTNVGTTESRIVRTGRRIYIQEVHTPSTVEPDPTASNRFFSSLQIL